MSKRLRWGILGTGNIARQFAADVVSSARRSELTAVGSRTSDAARAFAQTFKVPAAHAGYDALLADATVDAIYLTLPNSMHHEWTLKSLAAGKHVLCEKPFAINEAHSREMFDAAERAERVLMEAFMYRSHPQTLGVLEAIGRGEIGRVQLIRASFCYRTTRIDGNVRFSADLAGGALMDVGCYCINLARVVAGAEPISIFAAATLHERGVDVNTAGTLQFPGGILASFACGMNIQTDNAAYICGDEGFITIPWPWKPPKGQAGYLIARSIPPLQDKKQGALTPPPRQTIRTEADRDLYALEADEFAAAVLDGVPPRVSRDETIGNMRVLDAMRQQIGLHY
jgi:D-xylose 1-dehydrogenase (NADP+, D-xylono-1,5-lactone-forming)